MARWRSNGPRTISASRKRSREGNVAILTTLMLTMIMGFVALSFDIGHIYRVRTENQSAVDAAALAGASSLDGTSAGIDAAKARAVNFGNRHWSYTSAVALTTGDIVPGVWDFKTNSFSQGGLEKAINAIKVTYNVPSVSMPFASALGKSSTPVMAQAIAVGGGPADATCGFPLVVPECALGNADVNGLCEYCMQMQDNNNDTIGWTGFDKPSSGPNIYSAIALACTDASGNPKVNADGECDGQCGRTEDVTKEVDVNNGNLMNNSKGNFCKLIEQILNRDGSPKAFTVTVPVVDAGGTQPNCPRGSQLSGSMPITGYTQLDIFAAKCANPDPGVSAPPPANWPAGFVCQPPPSGKYLVGALHCDKNPTNDHAGGPFNGVSAETRLVQ